MEVWPHIFEPSQWIWCIATVIIFHCMTCAWHTIHVSWRAPTWFGNVEQTLVHINKARMFVQLSWILLKTIHCLTASPLISYISITTEQPAYDLGFRTLRPMHGRYWWPKIPASMPCFGTGWSILTLPIWQHTVVVRVQIPIFLAATKQLYKWYFPSVCLSVRPSVRLSVCHTFYTMFPSSYHEIFRSHYHGQKWCPCKRSRSEVKGQGHSGQHPT